MKKIYINEDVCTGCGLCRVNCIVEHSKSKNINKAFKKESPKPTARLRIEERKPISFSVQCRHCDEPRCVEACISGAMIKDEDGIVYHIEEKCVGCLSCVMVCEYGGVIIDKDRDKVVKCDLCIDRDIPACVAGCPNEALFMIEENEIKVTEKNNLTGIDGIDKMNKLLSFR